MRVPRPSRSEQKKQIEDIVLLKQHVAVGDTWYIISKKWFQDWEDFVQGGDNNDGDNNDNDDGNDKEPPGPIDNSMLISEDNTLKRGLVEYGDYELIAEDAWNLLHQWYSGGPSMGRRAIQLRTRSHILVEVRPLTLTVCHPRHPDSLLHCSKGDTIGSIKQQICTLWNLNAASMEVWDAAGVLVEDMDKQLAELYVADGQKITVTDTRMTMADVSPKAAEEDSSQSTSEISTYPSSSYSSYPSSSSSSYSSSSSSSSYTSSYSYSSYYDQKPKQPPPPPGIVGLNNLGNTCFMNSSLQCMSNTVPLTEFFLSGAYEKDINLENPLGTQGKLVEEFARLIKELWNGRHSAVAPRDFKSRLERFASQFTGYQQHDSQELLAFLLDGLHEDLNRVKKKVYASAREGDDIPDVERAKEAWEIHKNRNDSVIVDWFQAALKSTLVCPTCGKVSVTFDPFMYLSLPLPMKVDRSVPLTLVTLDAAQPPTKYLVKVPKIGTIATLKAKLAEMAGVSADCLILTDVFNCKFFKKFNDSESIDSFDEERDVLYAYQVKPQPPPRERDSSDNDNDNDSDNDEDNKLVHCAVYNRKDEARNPHYPHLTPGTHLFGSPFFVSVAPNITYRALYQLLKASVQRWIKNPDTLNPDILNPDQNTESVDATETQGEESQRLSSDDESASRLFTIQTVDNHGYHENPLNDNDAPLQLDNKTTLAIHWKPEALPFLEDSKFSVNHSSMSTGDPSDPSGITLDKCMSLYTTTERLGPDDPWYCNRCKEHKQATKKFDLWSAPRILVVHLKRFSYRNKYFREKLETLVTCPLKGFDLSAHIIGPSDYSPIYDLYAVSNHYGSLGGGHYTAYALNKSTNKWYTFDDSHVTEMDESQVISPHAYVLFYRRRDTLALSSVPASLQTSTDNRESASGLQKSDDTMEENTPIQTSMDLD